ncbi:MAG: hypothetical protein EOP56_05795 [Sphingobacteriales bacterium]|nr:MAG: hypothetical protein EOP56_05795 [Sphingobacteriales bacterium]
MWIKPKRLAIFKAVATGYFLVLSAINFFSTVANGLFRWSDLLFFLLCFIAFLLRHTVVLLWFGVASLLLWAYLTLAITDDLIDYCSGIDHYSRPMQYFGIGYALMLTSVMMSLLMIFAYFMHKDHVDFAANNQ